MGISPRPRQRLGAEASGRSTRVRPLLLLAAVSSGGLLAPLNSTMLAVALPDIRAAFGVSHTAIGWLVSAYLIAMAVGQPIGGRMGDQMGRARMFRSALLAFLACSIAAALAPWFPLLIVLRIGQALVGATLIPNGMAMLRTAVPPDRLGAIFGMNGAVLSIAAASGPLIGAALLAVASWRALFLMNVPVIVCALLLQARFVPVDARRTSPGTVDWLGGLLFTAVLVAVTVALGDIRHVESPALLAGVLVGGGLAAWWFARRLRTSETPAIEWRLFRTRSFAAGTVHVLLTNLVMYTTLLTIPFFIREVLGGSTSTSGLLLGAMSLLMALVAPISGRISDRFGRRLPAMIGSSVALAGALLLLAGISRTVSVAYLGIALAVVGTGVGMGSGAASTAAIESAPTALAGAASGTNSMMRYLGSIVGAGVLAGVLTTGGDALPGIGVFRLIFALVSAMAALTIPVASMLHRFLAEKAPATV